jgi:hypothetical protein
MKRWFLPLGLFAVAVTLGVVFAAMRARIGGWAEGHWDTQRPPGYHLTIVTYQASGFLALCFATAALLSVGPVCVRFRSHVIAPLLERRALSSWYLLALYPLSLVVFALSYNVPLLGRLSEALEEPLGVVFYPFLAIGAEHILSPVANGFSGGASDHGEPLLTWFFFIVLAAFAWLAVRIIFRFGRGGRDRRGDASSGDGGQA